MSDQAIDSLREAIQLVLAGATGCLEGHSGEQGQALVEQGALLIRQHSVAGAVVIPGCHGDRWALDLRDEAERARCLSRVGVPGSDALQLVLRCLARRQEQLFALRGFGTTAQPLPAVAVALDGHDRRKEKETHALACLLKFGANAARIARQVGVPRTTLLGWPEFRQRYDQAKGAAELQKRSRRRGRRAGDRDFEVVDD